MSSTSTSNIILNDPYTYFIWFVKIRSSVPEDLWQYFNPEREDEMAYPQMPVLNEIRDGATTLQILNQSEKATYTYLRSIFNHELMQYQRFLAEKAKLRERIMISVSDSKQFQLPAEESIQQWLEHLAELTRSSDYQMQEMIRAKH
jgi:hypothetical protein